MTLFVGVVVSVVAAEEGRMLKELSRELASQGLDVSSAVLGMLGIIVAIVAALFGLIALISGLCILHRLWSLIPADKAKTTPGKAIGFLFIPLFNFFWSFIAIYGLAKALNTEARRRAVSEVTCFFFCCLYLLDPLWLIMGESDAKNWIFLIGYIVTIVLWLTVLKQMKNAGVLILQGTDP